MHNDQLPAGVKRFQDLRAWQAAIEMAVEFHQLAACIRRRDRSGLAGQIRRAAASVPANIAEGNGRFSSAEYLRFLSIANGSLRESESHLVLAVRLELVSEQDTLEAIRLSNGASRLLVSLARKLRQNA